MKTTYYTITAREILVSGDGVERAVGGGRQLVCARKTVPAATGAAKRNNVIDLAAWKAARKEEVWQEQPEDGREPAPAFVPRARRDHSSRALAWAEWLATVSVIGVMALLALRILQF